ncbi:MAG TPA: hypothetical protein VG498_19495 [Terriglobales bacterium]|nr:hypothetical protein [Terriglobales bacterium]
MIPAPVNTIPDRELHDRVITYLTDANLRSGMQATEFLDDSEVERADRFSRFLARRYYRDRLIRAFRYSALVAPECCAERVLDSPDFEAILATCVLGSLATSERVGGLALSYLLPAGREHSWWSELLEYERAFFRELATSEVRAPSDRPQKNIAASLRKFSVSMPELLEAVSSRQTLSGAFAGEVTLLFSRTPHGRIYVAEVDRATAAVFDAIDGCRTAQEVASSCRISAAENQRILATLSDIGSIVLPLK